MPDPTPPAGAKRALRQVAKALADPGRAAQVLQHQRDVRADARGLAVQLGSAWAEPAPPGKHEGVDALFLPLGAWPWQVKLEVVLGKALGLRGLRPGYLVWRARWPEVAAYAKAFGVANPVFADDFLPERDPVASEPTLRALLDREWSFEALGALEFHGVGIGRIALASMPGEPAAAPLRTPRTQAALHEALGHAAHLTLAAERLFDALQPRVVLALERPRLPWAPVVETAVLRGLNVVQYARRGSEAKLVVRRLRPSNRHHEPWALAGSSWERVRAMPEPEAGPGGSRLPGETAALRTRLALASGRKVAAILASAGGDGVHAYGRMVFGDPQTWLARTLEAALKNDSLTWLLVMDDAARAAAERGGLLRGLPDHVRVLPPGEDASHLEPLLDAAVTVRSPEGIDLASRGVPVVTAGTGGYDHRGFTIDPGDEDDYLACLATLHERPRLPPTEAGLARRHAWAARHLRGWRPSSVAFVRRELPHDHPLREDVELRVRRPVELLTAQDLKALVEWAVASQEEEYFEAPPTAGPP